jgi:L,D-transpeptidase catalytic domain
VARPLASKTSSSSDGSFCGGAPADARRFLDTVTKRNSDFTPTRQALFNVTLEKSRRDFLMLAGGAIASGALLAAATPAAADPYATEAQWIANHMDTRLLGSDGAPVAWVPAWTHMRLVRGLPGGLHQVWVPRLGLFGRVLASSVGPVPTPSPEDLAQERAEPLGPPVMAGAIGMPGRVIGAANLRLWPAARPDTLLRSLGHNAPLRVLTSVEGDDGEEWYHVSWLDGATNEPLGYGYVTNSLVRLPRLHDLSRSPDQADRLGRWFEADLREPALLVAYENGGPMWSTLSLKGTVSKSTPLGRHEILWRVANETMTSERVYPPIPRDEPGGYYLTGVLWTQYFTSDGASIHYNYWSSNWGYAGSHGCLGIPYNEAKFAWDWASVGTPVYVFA